MVQAQEHAIESSPAEIYHHYLVPSLIAPLTPEVLRYAAPKPGERVLDVACGAGAATRGAAAMIGPAGVAVGLDINPDMLAIARTESAPDGAAIEWIEGSAEELPFADASFDLVLCQQGLQYFADRAAAMRQMRRVLKPGGRVTIVVWRGIEHHPFDIALNAAIERAMGAPVMTTPYVLGDPDDLRALIEDAGFRDTVIHTFDFHARFLDPSRYISLFVMGAASVLPDFAAMSDTERNDLVETVSRDAHDTIAAYTDGDALVMPNSAQIAVAVA